MGWRRFWAASVFWVQFSAELETPEHTAPYKEFLDNYVQEQKQLGRFKRPLNTFMSDVMAWMDVMGVVSNDNRVLMRLSFLFLVVCCAKYRQSVSGEFPPARVLKLHCGARWAPVGAKSALQNLFEVAVIGVLGGIAGVGLAWLGLALIGRLYQGYQHLVHLNGLLLLTAGRVGGECQA